ncbi:MAG TPA: PilZ domain-containing protein [Thermoanaerobaculia bacterium]|nr:PilZ domain-containing protein [Thermoanaerobaculia bacterium]
MKRLVELTAEDLAAEPVWRYEGGAGAAAMVVPIRRDALSRSDDEVFLAATDFGLFDGSRHVGYCFPADDSGIDYLQPSIVVPGGQVAFWTEGPASPAELAERWRVLGKEPGQIFPASFRCRIPVDGGIVSGWIAGIESSRDLTVAIRELAPASGGRPAPLPDELERAPMARPAPARAKAGAVPDQRTARRRKAHMNVEFTQGDVHGTGVAENVSRRGLFVRTARAPGSGPPLRLTVNLPDGRKLVLTGRVVREAGQSATGFGLRLTEDWPNYDALFPRTKRG